MIEKSEVGILIVVVACLWQMRDIYRWKFGAWKGCKTMVYTISIYKRAAQRSIDFPKTFQ